MRKMEWEEEILANSKLNMGCFKTALANYGLWAKAFYLFLHNTAMNVSTFLNGWEEKSKQV